MILLDLLMATMDSIGAWSSAAGGREGGLAWRDAVTDRMIAAGRYVPYEDLVAETAAALGLSGDAPQRLWQAWQAMEPWPDAAALQGLDLPYAFVTNTSAALAAVAVRQSGLRPAFTLSAEEAGWYKPRPEIYHAASDRAGAQPREVRFVAGAGYDAAGAVRAGLATVLVNRRGERQAPSQFSVVASLDEALANI
jgi:2-haloalkanoic acid dehalogenase type II